MSLNTHNVVQKFFDSEFPPNLSSIYGPNIPRDGYSNIYFKRLEDILPPGTDIFKNGIVAQAINQGGLGDCWIVSCLSELAKYEQLIKRIIQNHFVNEEGKFVLTFYKRGRVCTVIVDSYLPFVVGTNQTFGIQSEQNYQCAIVLKGLAKLNKYYFNLCAGNCYEAMLDITGFPASNFEIPTNPKIYFQKLRELLSVEKILITAGIDRSLLNIKLPLTENRLPNGLSVDHTYSVYDTFDSSESGIMERKDVDPDLLVCLRNPQGHQFYCGKYAQNSEFWTPELRKKLNYYADNNDTGIVQVGFDDFRQFNTVSICNASPNFKTIRHDLKFNIKRKQNVIETPTIQLTIHDGKLEYVGLHQDDKRLSEQNKYIDMGAAIRKIGSENVCLLPNVLRRESQQRVDLAPGVYNIYPFTSGVHLKENEIHHDYTFTAHVLSQSQPDFKILPFNKSAYDEAMGLLMGQIPPQKDLKQFSIHMKLAGDLMLIGAKRKFGADDQNALLVDATKSENILPSYDSPISTLEPNQITFGPNDKERIIIFKYIRKDENAFKFACSFNEGVLCKQDDKDIKSEKNTPVLNQIPRWFDEKYHFINGRFLVEYQEMFGFIFQSIGLFKNKWKQQH